ncbi:MAG: CHAT domain-containing protein [Nostocaceae cyanobacterium]|nr:CHAT domain-containing protein [Nostocaceae cyanobacterium]
MSPQQLYGTVLTFALLMSAGCGIAFPEHTPVTVNVQQEDKQQESAQTSPSNNSETAIIQLNKQAINLSEEGRFADALQKLKKALEISTEIEKPLLIGATFNNTGRVYQQQGKYQQALKSYLLALVIHKELALKETNPGVAHINFGKTYSNLGYLFALQNQPELAVFFYKHCVNNREKVRLNPKAFSQPKLDAYSITVAQTYRALGEVLIKSNRTAEAQKIMDLIKLEELEGYLQNIEGSQRSAKGVELLATEKPIKQKLDKTLDDSIALGKEIIKLRQIPPEKRSPQQKQRLTQLVVQEQQLLEDFNNFIASSEIQEQVEKINRTARRQNLDLESLNAIRDDLAKLPEKSVLIYPLLLNNSLELIFITPESPPIRRTVTVKQEELQQTIRDFRQALQNPSRDIKKTANQLYNWLIKPIEKDLKQTGAKTLLYAPDGQLRYIPLSALYDGKQWLVQRYNINHITAASLTNFNTPPESQLRVLAAAFTKGNYKVKVGNRQFAFSGLPFAGKEVDYLATTLPGTKKIIDDAFSPKLTVPQMDDYTIVHLATHAAFMVGKPEDSFILFGNGERATLKEIATWSLPSVDLVVLSACETGLGGRLGNGEEILGFGYQIQRTGAKSAIASLWAVDDGGTQVLMNTFYDLLYSGKLTKVEALQKAQIALITGNLPASSNQQHRNNNIPAKFNTNLSHPYYWAPFILIGNGL